MTETDKIFTVFNDVLEHYDTLVSDHMATFEGLHEFAMTDDYKVDWWKREGMIKVNLEMEAEMTLPRLMELLDEESELDPIPLEELKTELVLHYHRLYTQPHA